MRILFIPIQCKSKTTYLQLFRFDFLRSYFPNLAFGHKVKHTFFSIIQLVHTIGSLSAVYLIIPIAIKDTEEKESL